MTKRRGKIDRTKEGFWEAIIDSFCILNSFVFKDRTIY